MMVMTGSLDRGATGKGPEWKLEPFKYAPPPDKYGVLVQDATHMSFLGRLAEDGGTQSQGFWTLLRTFSARGTDQKAVFRHVRIATIAFWDAYLKGNAKAKSYLQSDALPTYSKGAVRLERK
jgi:predicted dienelactone hydrolase